MNSPIEAIKVKVEAAEIYTRQNFVAYKEDWDLGDPIAYGMTIREALENFLEACELRYDEIPNYKWS